MVIVALQQYTMLRNLQPKVDTRHGIFLTKTKTFLLTYSEPLHEGQAYAIGIGYSWNDCRKENNHIPTKFVKITKEILKWMSRRGKDIIVLNHEECKLGKGIFGPNQRIKICNFIIQTFISIYCILYILVIAVVLLT